MSDLSQPPWLQEETEIAALLSAALDRFDRQPGELRQRDVSLPIEKHLPSLARADALADQTWALVQELARRGAFSIRKARRGAYDAEWTGARLIFAPESEAILRDWLTRGRIEPAMKAWRRAVQQQASAFPGDCESLLNRRIAVPDRTADEIVGALARLRTVKTPATLRQLSAFAFWGDSKVLDDREELIVSLFPHLEIRDRPIVVSVFLPPVVTGVLFIENQDTYTAAIAGQPQASADHALVYLAGFRSTALRIRRPEGACLHFAGPGADGRAAFEQWWFREEVAAGHAYFWGDLDFAGMQMLRVLRQRFGALNAWRPGYEPMLELLRREGGRIASGADQQRQVDPGVTGCEYADQLLLPAIREHGFRDQETIGRGSP